MNHFKERFPHAPTQTGIALVVTLLLLFVMTVAAVSAMGSVTLQERMSGNTRIQAHAFEAASAGISQALPFAKNKDHWVDEDNITYDSCNVGDDWIGRWHTGNTFKVGDAEFRLRVYCIANETFADEAGFTDAGIDIPPQLFVLSEGQVIGNKGEVLSRRQIEVRVGDWKDRKTSAIRIEGEPEVKIDPSTSNKFLADGNGGPAVSASTQENRDIIFDEIKDVDRLANYEGGISQSEYDGPWTTPSNLQNVVNKILESDCEINSKPGNEDLSGGGSLSGITHVKGNLTLSGNPSGTGLLIVEGDISWIGTADFKGVVIGLGGNFKISGGGGGRTEGTIFLTNIDMDATSPEFGSTTLNVAGGGNHSVTYDCEKIEAQRQILNSCLDEADKLSVDDWLGHDCATDGLTLGFKIESWRENLGWRETLFDPGN